MTDSERNSAWAATEHRFFTISQSELAAQYSRLRINVNEKNSSVLAPL